MARRNKDDLFRQLNKETPIIKRKNAAHISSEPRSMKKNSFDLLVEKKTSRKRSLPAPPEPSFSGSKRKTVYKKSRAQRGIEMAKKYSGVKQQDTEASPKRDPDIFTEMASETKAEPDVVPSVQRTSPRPRRSLDSGISDSLSETREFSIKRTTEPRATRTSKRHMSEALVNEEGSLTFRHELKYYINYRDYLLLSNALKALVSLDAYAGEDATYHIRSLYFDDMYDSALREKVDGSDGRKKYRIRIYNFSDSTIKFEKKMKQGQYVAKSSILLSRSEYQQIAAGEYSFLKDRNEPLASEIYLEMKSNLLRPRVLVDYQREAYVSPYEDVRITFDKDLKSGLVMTDIFDSDTPSMPMYDTGIMVLEVKFNRYLPEFIRCVLNNLNSADRSAISKYVISRKFD